MLFALAFVVTFVNGGLTGLFLGNVVVDVPLSDTMFVVAHFHMVMGVAPILVIFGAIYHWYPKMTGRMLHEGWGKFHFWVTFVGAYAIFFPMHYVGLVGVPRRYVELGDPAFVTTPVGGLNAFITVAALIVGFAQMVFLFNIFWSLRHGQRGRRQSLARRQPRMADPRDAPRSRQLGQGAADRLPLGLRLQRPRRAAGLHRPGRPLAAAPGAEPGMSVILVFILVVIGFSGWWLSQQGLMSKPWLEVGPDPVGGPRKTGMPTEKIALGDLPRGGRRALRAVRQRLLHAHGVRRLAADAGAAHPVAQHRHAAARQRRARVRALGGAQGRTRDTLRLSLATAAVATLGFLGGQLAAWHELAASGFLVTGNPSNSFFYVLTGLHGLHILGGLVALARAAPAAWGLRPDRLISGSASTSAPCTGTSCSWSGSGSSWCSPAGRTTSSTSAARSCPEAFRMAEISADAPLAPPRLTGLRSIPADWASDQRVFKDTSWKKAMMWIFLLSDTFVFSCFLLSYMTARMSTVVPWPNPSEVFALHMFGQDIPLILIAIMTFVLISSSGTMALAVNFGYRRDRRTTALLMLATAALGATFVGMQAFEWTKLIQEGVRPWGNPWGAEQFGASLLHDHRLPRHPRDDRRDLPLHHRAEGLARRLRHRAPRLLHQPPRGLRERRGDGALLALRRPRLGLHLRFLLSLVRQA